ncbi:MAG: OmpA family protein [Spirulina sp. SIO3F2]|nr:OmpA family protein [Spirulina sp. SIO3F2]
MANFSSLPDPWDDSTSDPQQPESAATSTQTIPPAPDLDTDLFRDVLVDLDSLLGNPNPPNSEATPEPSPQTPPEPEQSPKVQVTEPTSDVPNLTDRISKFEPLDLEEPVDETLPLLDMPLADLQATFGIGTKATSQQPPQPSTPEPPSPKLATEVQPTTAPKTPPATTQPTELKTTPQPAPEPPKPEQAVPQTAKIQSRPQPTSQPKTPDPIRDAAIAYRKAEVNETVSILNDLFDLDDSQAKPTSPQTASQTQSNLPASPQTTLPPSDPPETTVVPSSATQTAPAPSSSTQLPFPEDDIFPVLGTQTTADPNPSTQEVNELLAALGAQPGITPETPSTTEIAPVQTESTDKPTAPAAQLSPTPLETATEAETNGVETNPHITSPPPETSTPKPTAPPPNAPGLEQQLTKTILNLVNHSPETETSNSPEPEDAAIAAATVSNEVVPLSPLEQRRVQLEAQLERELQAFWDAANNQLPEQQPESQPPSTQTQASITTQPQSGQSNGNGNSQTQPATTTPTIPRTPSEQLDAAVESTFGILSRDFNSLFSSSSSSESDEDPLQEIRQYLVGNQPQKKAPTPPPPDPAQPLTNDLEDLTVEAAEPPSTRLMPDPAEPPRYSPVEIEPFKRFEAIEDKLAQLEKQVYEPTDVINPLLPLIAQLLKMRLGTTQDTVREMATPILDEMILARSTQNREAMTQAFASLIPDAITQEIHNNPERIAKAIGPEVGAAIREQIRIERDSISESLGPTIGKAIKTQIEVERDSMVDALYPVIGSTVSRYMGEVLNTINEKVESTLSIDGVSRKIRARVQGVSEAELILQESMPATIQAMFLIHKTSGLVIAEVQPNLEQRLESNMIAGMLTAIRSFVNDCIAQTGEITELNEIEYGDSRIMLEVAGYCYLAIVAKGKIPKPMIDRLRRVFSQITQRHGRYIEDFEGEMETVPPEITTFLKQVGDEQNDRAQQQTKPKRSPTTLLVILGLLAALLTIPWLYFQVRGWFDQRLSRQVAGVLAEELDPVAYEDLVPTVNGKQLQLDGRVPSAAIQERAAVIAQEMAPKKTITNNIKVVQAPLDPAAVATSVQVVTSILNREPGVDIQTQYTPEQVTVSGTYSSPETKQTIEQALGTLPGIPPLNIQNLTPQIVQERIYFDTESAVIAPAELNSKVVPLAAFLQAQPNFHIRLIGHTDPRGTEKNNAKLAQARAQAVRNQLLRAGVQAKQLEIAGDGKPPPGIGRAQPFWLNRCVRFEIIKR